MARGRSRFRLCRGVIELGGGPVGYSVRRTVRRKHVHLVIDDARGLEVRVPYRYAAAGIEPLLRANEAWILERLERRRRARGRPLVTGTPLPFLGETMRLEIAVEAAPRIERIGARLRVGHPDPDRGALLELVEAWYRREAGRALTNRLRELATAYDDLWPARVQIRAQRTRWGSCSARGTISLNWRLLLVPRDLADYVLVHELCHLRHLDHSPRFWRLVATVVPDHARRRRRLRALQDSLPW